MIEHSQDCPGCRICREPEVEELARMLRETAERRRNRCPGCGKDSHVCGCYPEEV